MTENDPVRKYLASLGCPPHVVRGGLPGLAAKWEGVVRSVDEGYGFGLDDYLNDLDTRQLIEKVLAVASEEERSLCGARIRQADAQMRSLVRPAGRCLWGEETAYREGWTAERNWWYFHVPIKPGEELWEEFDESGRV